LAVNDSVRRVWYRRGDPECQNSKGKDRCIPHDNLHWNTGNHLNQEQLRLLDLNQLQVRRFGAMMGCVARLPWRAMAQALRAGPDDGAPAQPPFP
jgi:hypothetical protein